MSQAIGTPVVNSAPATNRDLFLAGQNFTYGKTAAKFTTDGNDSFLVIVDTGEVWNVDDHRYPKVEVSKCVFGQYVTAELYYKKMEFNTAGK